MNSCRPTLACAALNLCAGAFGAFSSSSYAASAGSFAVIRSLAWRTCPNPCSAATGNCEALSRRLSMYVPLPCISRFATKAFHWVTEPHPVQVCRLTPARPNAGGISVAADVPSGRNAFPSRSSSASNLPGPQLFRTCRTVASSTLSMSATGCSRPGGARLTIAPTFRSRFAQPSSRCPMPGAKESSTAVWQAAQVMPTEVRLPASSKIPLTPTTALSLSRASVLAGSSRSTCPSLRSSRTLWGRASTSTLSPTASAVLGETPGPTPPWAAPSMALSSCRAPPQKPSSPKVSLRKMSLPCAMRSVAVPAGWPAGAASEGWLRARVTAATPAKPTAARATTHSGRAGARALPSGWLSFIVLPFLLFAAVVPSPAGRTGACRVAERAPGPGAATGRPAASRGLAQLAEHVPDLLAHRPVGVQLEVAPELVHGLGAVAAGAQQRDPAEGVRVGVLRLGRLGLGQPGERLVHGATEQRDPARVGQRHRIAGVEGGGRLDRPQPPGGVP